MSTIEKSIFRLPSDILLDRSMSPTEYCQALPFLSDRVDPNSNVFHPWRGTPWYPNRTPPRPNVARALHHGSTPDFDINFADTRRPLVIGTGRPLPDSTAPPAPSMFKDSAILNQDRIRLATAKLAKLQGSKFAKLFPPSALYGEPTFTNGVDPRIWNVQATTRSPYDIHFKHNTACWEDLDPIVQKKKVTFDLGANSHTQTTAEQKADFRAKAHQMAIEEGLVLKNYNASEESSIDHRIWYTSSWITELEAELEAEYRARTHPMTKGEIFVSMREEINEQISRLDHTRHTLVRTTECGDQTPMMKEVDGQISTLDLIRQTLGRLIKWIIECGARPHPVIGNKEVAFIQGVSEEMSRLDLRHRALRWRMILSEDDRGSGSTPSGPTSEIPGPESNTSPSQGETPEQSIPK